MTLIGILGTVSPDSFHGSDTCTPCGEQIWTIYNAGGSVSIVRWGVSEIFSAPVPVRGLQRLL